MFELFIQDESQSKDYRALVLDYDERIREKSDTIDRLTVELHKTVEDVCEKSSQIKSLNATICNDKYDFCENNFRFS
jgi:hypothetical protein